MIHFSIQRDHVHLIVEADDESSFKAGVHSLAIRLALAINQSFGRKGRAIGDRYHARALSDPTQMRASMVYVLLNFRKHLRAAPAVDPFSSGAFFSGWRDAKIGPAARSAQLHEFGATALPRTWLATAGWLRAGGALSVGEQPVSKHHPT